MKKINIKGALLKTAATGGGAIAAASLNKVAFIAKQKPAIKGAINIAAGAFLPGLLGKGKKAEMFENFGAGMIAVGALQLANATVFKNAPVSIAGMPTLNGTPNRVFVPSPTMNGNAVGKTATFV